MSENLAGITLLAFGNGSPDIFASLSNISGDTELVYSELIGAAIFVTGFIAGTVIIIHPFKLVWRNYVRDVMFFLVAAIVISNFIHDQGYSITEGICTVMIYVLYICVVVFDHIRMKNEAKKVREMSIRRDVELSSIAEIVKRAESLEEATEIKIYNRKDSSVVLEQDILKVFQTEFQGADPNHRLLKSFMQAINPLDEREWKDAGWIKKVLMMLKVKSNFSILRASLKLFYVSFQAPVVFLLVLFIPIVDYGDYLHGWSKLLNMLNIVTLPQLLLFVTGYIKLMFFGYLPLSLIVFLVSLVASFVVFRTSRVDCPPKYHVSFAVGSFFGCVSVIYVVAKEVVCAMKTMGIISDRSDSFVGLLFLALGNSIGDLFSNISLARQGYHHMAFAACFGGPMFSKNQLECTSMAFMSKLSFQIHFWASA